MASAEDVKNESCIYDPDFAVVCSFFENFSSLCGIQPPSISELQQMLEDTHHTAPQLIDLHIRLMRKAKKNVNPDRWQKTLANFCYYAQPDDCWILEQKGYQCLSYSQKLKFLLTLIGAQFDLNSKFKTDVNKLDVKDLRLQPIGRDKAGNNYWVHMDKQTTLKVYKEDLDEEKWELIVQDREGLMKLIENLMKDKDPNRKLEELAEESESSESSVGEEEEPDVQTEMEDEDEEKEESEVDKSNEPGSKKSNPIEKEPSKKSPAASSIPKPVPKDDSRRVQFAEKLQQAYSEGPLSKASLNLLTRPRSANTTTPVKPLDKEAFTQHLQKLDSINMLKPLLTSTEPGDKLNPAAVRSDLLKAKINQKFSIIKPGLQTDIAKSKLESPTKTAKPGLKLEQILKSKLAQKLSGAANLGEKIEEKKAATERGENSVPKSVVPEPCKDTVTEPEKPVAKCRTMEDSSEEQPAKKCRLEEFADDGEEIEEPEMVVNGVGNGHDCNSGIPEDDEIEEPMMYIFGVGSGAECCTGNNENDDSSKNSSHTLHLTHKVDNMLKPASEGETTPSTSTGDIVDTEKKKPKIWTIDAICNSDSSKDSKRDSVPQFSNYKPYHSASESYSIFKLTENSESRDSASVIPTNFYFGSNNQNPCFLPAELSPTFKSSLHSVENIVESANKVADVKVSKFSAESLYSKTNNVNDAERVERTPEVSCNTMPETAPNDEMDFRAPACQSTSVETCEPQSESKPIGLSSPRYEEEVAENYTSSDRTSIVNSEAPVAVVEHDNREAVCPQPSSPASSSASEIDYTPAAASDSEEDSEELPTNAESTQPSVDALPPVADPQKESAEREPNVDPVENEAKEVEPSSDIVESPKPIEVAEPAPTPSSTENTHRELEAPVPRTEVVHERSEQEDKIPPPVAENSSATLQEREHAENACDEPQLDAKTQHSKLDVKSEENEPSESAIIEPVDQVSIGAMEQPLPVPTAKKCVPAAPAENEVVETVSTETETHKTDIEQKPTDNETESEKAEKQSTEDGGEPIQMIQSEQPVEKESLVTQEKNVSEDIAKEEHLLQNKIVKGETSEIPCPVRKESGQGKQKDASSVPAASPVENDVQKKGESEVPEGSETRRTTRSSRVRKSDVQIINEKVEKGKKASSKKDDVETPAKKSARSAKQKNEENAQPKNEANTVEALKITIRTNRNKSGDNEKEVVTMETSSAETVDNEKNEEPVEGPTEENDDAETASDKEETPKSAAKKPGRRGKKKKRVYSKKPAKPKTPKKEDKVAPEHSDGESTAKDDEQSNEPDGTPKKETPEPKKKKLKRGWLTEVDVSNIAVVADTGTPGIRQSRRIAQLKIKEQAETKYQETASSTKKSPANQKSKTPTPAKNQKNKAGKGKFKPPKEDSEEETYYELPSSKKKGKKKKDLPPKKDFDPKKPWKQSSESSSEEEDEEDHYEEDEEEFTVHDKSDHEFSPESDMEDEDYAPVKRARTAHSKPRAEDKTERDDLSCQSCGTAEQPEWILLCDSCDEGWHAACLKPPVMAIPEGDWFCPPCQHNKLITGLQMFLRTYDKAVRKRVSEESRRKRLEFVNVSFSNVIQPESAPKQKARPQVSSSSEESTEEETDEEEEPLYQLRVRRQANVRHRLNEYEELMSNAIERENGDVPVASLQAEQPAANVNGADAVAEVKSDEAPAPAPAPAPAEVQETNEEEKKESEESSEDEEEDEDDGDEEKEEEKEKEVPIILQLRNVRKKPARLTNLDVSSEDDHYSDEDFKGSSADDQDEDEEYAKSETDSDEASYRRGRGRREPVRRSTRARRTRYDNDFINDESDDDDDDEDDYGRKKKKKRISYAESESDEDSTWGRRKRKKNSQTYRAKPAKRRKRIKFDGDSDEDEGKKKGSRNSRIKYGLDEDEDVSSMRRTRGKKINYQDNSESEFEEEEASTKSKSKGRKILSDDEYQNEDDDQSKSAASENGEQSESGSESNESESAPKSKKAKILESDDSDSAPALVAKPPEVKTSELPTKTVVTADHDQVNEPSVPSVPSVITSTDVELETPLLPNNVVKDGPEAFVPKIDPNPSLQGMQSMAQNLSHPLPPPQFPPNVHPDAAAAFVGRPPQPAPVPVPVHYEMGIRFDSPDGIPPTPLQPGDKFPHPIRVPSPNKMYGLPDMQAGNRPHLPPFPPQQMQPPIIGPSGTILPPPGRPMPPAIPLSQMPLPRPEGGRPMPPAMPIPQGPMTMPEGGRPMPPAIPLSQMQMLPGPDGSMLTTIPRGPMAMPGPPMHSRPQHLIGPPPNVNIAQCGPSVSMAPPNAMPPNQIPPNSMPSTPEAQPKRRPRGRGKKQLEMERLQREREAMEANRNEEMIPLHVLKMPPPPEANAAGHPTMPPRPPFSTYQQIPFSQAPSPVQQQAGSSSKRVKITPTRMRMPTPPDKIVHIPRASNSSPGMYPPPGRHPSPLPVSSPSSGAPSPDGKGGPPVSGPPTTPTLPTKADAGPIRPESSEPQYYQHPPTPYPPSQGPRVYDARPMYAFARKPAPPGLYPPPPPAASTAPNVVVSRTGGFAGAAGPPPVSSPGMKSDSPTTATANTSPTVPQPYPAQYGMPPRGLPTTVVTSAAASKPGQSGPYIMSTRPMPPRPAAGYPVPPPHIKPPQSSVGALPYPGPYYPRPPYSSASPLPPTSQPPVTFGHTMPTSNFSPNQPAAPQPPVSSAGDASALNSLPPTSQSGDYQFSQPQQTTSAPSETETAASEESAPAEEASGEFGGLVSYFSSQREDDLDA